MILSSIFNTFAFTRMGLKRMIIRKRTYLPILLALFSYLLKSQDTIPPVFIQEPISISIPCESSNIQQQFTSWYSTAGSAIVFDNNGGAIQLVGNPDFTAALEIFNNSKDTLCGNTKNIEVTFMAIDQSGNTSIPKKAEFSLFDDKAPVISISPSAFTGECINTSPSDLINWIKNKAGAVATDICSDTIIWTNFVYTTSTNQNGQSSIDNGPYPTIPVDVCNWFVNISFYFEDDCGNIGATAIRKFEIKDTRPPTLSLMPSNITVNCDAIPDAPSITAIDDCSGVKPVLFFESSTQSVDTLSCNYYNYTITRRWSATDACNNDTSYTQTIVVNDIIKPSPVYEDTITIDCKYTTIVDSLILSITDNCSPTFLTYQDSLISDSLCNDIFKRKYEVRDVCNNLYSFSQLIFTEDKSVPLITSQAQNINFDCNANVNIQNEFNLWLENFGGSTAIDDCSNIKRFYALPGSYSIGDTATFPGNSPLSFVSDKCNSFIEGYSRAQLIDFVYYDLCGNASKTSAIFGVSDFISPTIINCPVEILRNIESTNCTVPVDIKVPDVLDNCASSTSPIVKTISADIKSITPGDNNVIVDSIIMSFSGYNPNAFTINGSGLLTLNMKKVDADNDTEFFRVYDENGNLLGQTNHTSQQCQDIITDFNNIPIDTINKWLMDSVVTFKLVPNVFDPLVLSINDICPGSRVDATFSFPIDESNLVQSYFTIEGSGDTTNTTKIKTIQKSLSSGIYNSKFVFTDCAKNESTCDITINIRDASPPVLTCNNDTSLYVKTDSCIFIGELPLNINVKDNCLLPTIYDVVEPVNNQNSLITFRYLENLGLHVANNKSVPFSNVPKIINSNNDAILEVTVTGDINNTTEYFDILAEGGVPLGKTNRSNSTDCGSSVTSFTLPKNTFNNWADDGNIIFTAVANNNTNEEGSGINSCTSLMPNDNIDNISKLTMRLIISDATLTYSLANGLEMPINSQENKIELSLSEGIHKIDIFSSDSYGNKANCTFNINVMDTIAPIAKCKNFIARVHPSGLVNYYLSPDSINNNSIDNCGIDSISIEETTFICGDVGKEKNIVLTVTDVNGNTSSCTSIVRIENTILYPTFTAGLCDGDTLKLFANIPEPDFPNTYQYKWTKDAILVANEENPSFVANGVQNNGLYTLEVTGFNGCKAEGVLQVNIQPLTPPIITVESSSYCLYDTVLLEATEYTGTLFYDWYEGFPPMGTPLTTTTIPQLKLNPSLGIHNYYVIVRNDDCTSNSSQTKRVTIFEKPVANVTIPFQTICEGKSIKLETTSSGIGYSYKWTGPNNYSSEEKNPDLIDNVNSVNQGIYELTIKVGECKSDVATVTAIILPKPPKPIIVGEDIYCEGNTLSIAVTNLSPQEKYFWYKNGVFIKTTQVNFLEIINVTPNSSGSWQVVVESNTCLSDISEIKQIEVADLNIAGASNSGPHCEGDTVTLIATSIPNASYSWKGPGDISGIGQQLKTIARQGDYVVTISTPTGCSTTVTTYVEVNKPPIITAMSNTSTHCMDGNTDIVFSPSITPAGNYSYKWTGPNMFMFTEKNAVIKNAKPTDNGEYIFTVFNKNCPSLSDTTNINIASIPAAASINPISNLCEGDILSLTTDAIADKYYWHTPLGVLVTTGPALLIPNASKSNEGNYHLIIEKNGCISTSYTPYLVVINDKPTQPIILGENEVCFNDTILLKPSGNGYDKIIWTLPNGNKQTSNSILIPKSNTSHQGNYSVSVEKNGCMSEESQVLTIKVKDEIKPSDFNTDIITTCSNDTLPIEICIEESTITSGASYKWISETGEIISIGETICRIISSAQLIQGNNFIRSITQLDGCEAPLGKPLIIIKNQAPNLIAKANIDETFICTQQDILELTSIEKEPTVEVNWQALTNGINILSPEDDKTLVSNFQEGNNLVVLSYSKDGCNNFSFDTVVIRFNAAPIANDDEVNIAFNTTTEIAHLANDITNIGYVLTYDDEDLLGTIQSNNTNFIYTPKIGFAGEEIFTYKLCIDGCENLCDDATVKLIIGENIDCLPPTIFTPNEDGINDKFIIPCLNTGSYPDSEIYIYNQWGDQVFHANPYENDWKGTYGGNELPVGTYYFVFNAQKNKNPITGFIILQR